MKVNARFLWALLGILFLVFGYLHTLHATDHELIQDADWMVNLTWVYLVFFRGSDK